MASTSTSVPGAEASTGTAPYRLAGSRATARLLASSVTGGAAGIGGTMTLSEAAVILGVHPDTLRRQVRLGKLRAKKHGPIWWVTAAEVARYARESKRGE